MQKLIESVRPLVEEEYGRAGAKFGLTNHSDRESYAILLEEVEEAEHELIEVRKKLGEFWNHTRDDERDLDKLVILRNLQTAALLAACECIQVAAMAKKAAMTVCERAAMIESLGREEDYNVRPPQPDFG